MEQDTLITQHRLIGEFCNIVLHCIHLFIIIFSITGWMYEPTRGANFILLLAILISWYILGPLFGKSAIYGYCLVTDLQWKLKKKLGHEVPPWGYMKYLVDHISGRNIDENLVDKVTAFVFFISLAASSAHLFFD